MRLRLFMFRFNPRQRQGLRMQNEAGDMRGKVNRRGRAAPALVARSADDAAGRGVDVDPDDAPVLHELQAISVALELGAEIFRPAHERHHPPLDHRQRHRAALAGGAEGAILVARAVAEPARFAIGGRTLDGGRRRRDEARQAGGGKEGTKQAHGKNTFRRPP